MLRHDAKLFKSGEKNVDKTCIDDAKISNTELSTPNQFELGWYGVVPSMGILLITTGTTSLGSPTDYRSPKMGHFSSQDILLYIGWVSRPICNSV